MLNSSISLHEIATHIKSPLVSALMFGRGADLHGITFHGNIKIMLPDACTFMVCHNDHHCTLMTSTY